jgi:hypothetical protein
METWLIVLLAVVLLGGGGWDSLVGAGSRPAGPTGPAPPGSPRTDEQSRSSRRGKDSKWGLAEVHSGGSGRTRKERALCGMPCGHSPPGPEIEVEVESRRGILHQACFGAPES